MFAWLRSFRRGRTSLALILGLAVAVVALTSAIPPSAAARPTVTSATSSGSSDWPVYHQDGLGSGVDQAGTSLTSASPAWTSVALDGQIYGEPLVAKSLVIVATENDTVYALSASTGAIVWHTHIATPVPSGDLPCGDISPTVGITSTPVIDPALGEVFVVADESTSGSGAAHHLVGLNLSTGAVVLDTAVDPSGSHPLYQLQRPGLALDDGQVIIGFGGNDGDCESPSAPYHGWLVAVPEGGGTMKTFEVASNSGDSQGAIWQGGAAPVVDASGNIWVATGNSAFTASTDPYDDSDGVLELSSSLSLEQSFAPSDWYADNGGDRDLGSMAPALLTNGLVFQAGKSQTGYLLSQATLGGVGGQLATASSYCGNDVDGGAAVVGNVAYVPCRSGVVATETSGSPATITVLWQTSTGSGGPPIVAGGLVWTINYSNGYIYGLDPSTGNSVESFSLGSVANHFPTPTAVGDLLLAASSDQVHAFKGPPSPRPKVAKVTPSSGPATGGTTVTITGSKLTGATKVMFGTKEAARFKIVSAGKIVAHTAAHAAGTVNVRVTTPEGTSVISAADKFTFS